MSAPYQYWARQVRENVDSALGALNSTTTLDIIVDDAWFERIAHFWDDFDDAMRKYTSFGNDQAWRMRTSAFTYARLRTPIGAMLSTAVGDEDWRWIGAIDARLNAIALESLRSPFDDGTPDSVRRVLDTASTQITDVLTEYNIAYMCTHAPSSPELQAKQPGDSVFGIIGDVVVGVNYHTDYGAFVCLLAPYKVNKRHVVQDMQQVDDDEN